MSKCCPDLTRSLERREIGACDCVLAVSGCVCLAKNRNNKLDVMVFVSDPKAKCVPTDILYSVDSI